MQAITLTSCDAQEPLLAFLIAGPMNISTMRRVDRWIGAPLCALLTIARRLGAGSPKHRRNQGPPERILFLKLAEQGSTVLAAPALHRAIELVGRENVYALVFEENRCILDLMDVLPRENVIAIRTGGVASTLRRVLAAVRRIRELRIDSTVDLEFFARSTAILSWLSGASRRVGFHRGGGPWRGDLMTHRLRFNPHLHTSQTFLSMVESLVTDPTVLPATTVAIPETLDEPPAFEPGADEVAEARRIVRDASATEDPFPLVLLNPNCSDMIPLRAWPRGRYVELARRLLAAHPRLHVALTGAPEEAAAAADLAGEVNSDRCFSLAGRTSLRQLIVIYTLAEVLVTNDSGPAHFATLTPIDAVTLFGPEHPALFAARTPRNHVLWSGLVCSPCVSALNNRVSTCRDNLCMQEIGVDQVFGVVQGVLRDRLNPQWSERLEVVTRPTTDLARHED